MQTQQDVLLALFRQMSEKDQLILLAYAKQVAAAKKIPLLRVVGGSGSR